ncbi:MAG: toxin TcdB middle/N-terminal domain-containing protein, partial [Paludibacteraceae bacterium]
MNLFNSKFTIFFVFGLISVVLFGLFSKKNEYHNAEVPKSGFAEKNYAESKDKIESQAEYAEVIQEADKAGRQISSQESLGVFYKSYLAGQDSGIIGIFQIKSSDDPSDNIFDVFIDSELSNNDNISLCYTLTGLDDHSNISFSINDRPAVGGFLSRRNLNSTKQKVAADASWFRMGNNRIQFSIPNSTSLGYKIENLSITVESGDDYPFAINFGSSTYDNQAYFYGFMKGREDRNSTLMVNGQSIAAKDGFFEGIAENIADGKVEAVMELNGKKKSKIFYFSNNSSPDNILAFNRPYDEINKVFSAGEADTLRLANGHLNISDTSLAETKTLSISKLRSIDIPSMDYGLTNVTAESYGLRFLPHGNHFKGGATVSIKYDKTKIPSGYTEDDIKTYYFDTGTNHWVALERESLDKELCMVTSRTTHFTDMINGVIQAPESPETQGFAPTMMNDIKAADPVSGIQLISPPSANNSGSANLSYTLELLPARSGINPDLTIQYNSDGGSGWLGEGWDLSIPTIAVDTRWGVPRYDPNYETEIYTLNGVRLATILKDTTNTGSTSDVGTVSVAHRGLSYPRNTASDTTVFYSTVENDFSKIIRLGNNPGGYTWKVFDKNGIVYTYADALSGDIKSFRYSELNGDMNADQAPRNVQAEWKLSSIYDPRKGTTAKYFYKKSEENITSQSSVRSKAIYLSSIEIGQVSQNNSDVDSVFQTIKFVQGDDKSKQRNNARYGFLASSNKLLASVQVFLNGSDAAQIVRSYHFNYQNGDFNSDLLQSIVHKDETGKEISSHDFDYSKTDNLFEESLEIDTKSGGLALGGGDSNTSGSTISGGVGIGFPGFASAGADYTRSNSTSKSTSLVTIIDINGDGLPDKVLKSKNSLLFVPNLGNNQFGNPIEIFDSPNLFSYSETKTIGNGLQFGIKGNIGNYVGVSANAGTDKSTTYSDTHSYFTDVNNDGLIDIVNNNLVYFNVINRYENGIAIPSFSKHSYNTLNPIKDRSTPRGRGELLIEPLQRDQSEFIKEKKEIYAAIPMQDIVRVWEAPRAGRIRVTGNVKLVAEQGKPSDGLTVSIQWRNIKRWEQYIPKSSTTSYSHDQYFDVNAGEKIFFRLQSLSTDGEFSSGHNDIVIWYPAVEYANTPRMIGANRFSSNRYEAREGFIVNKLGYNLINYDGTVRLKGMFFKPVTADDVKLKVYLSTPEYIYKDTIITSIVDGEQRDAKWTIKIPNNIHITKELISQKSFLATSSGSFEVTDILSHIPGEKHFWFEVSSSSNIRWEEVKWCPELHSVTTQGKDTLLAYGGVKYEIFNNVIREATEYFTIEQDGPGWCDTYDEAKYFPALTLTPADPSKKINAECTISIYDDFGDILASSKRQIINNVLFDKSSVKVEKPGVQKVTVGFYINDTTLITRADAVVNCERWRANKLFCAKKLDFDLLGSNIGIYSKRSNSEMDFGPMWRGWGQFEYNAAEDRWNRPIEEDKLHLPEDTSELRLEKMMMFNMNPSSHTKQYWSGLNENFFIKGDTMSCGRLNLEYMPNLAVYTDPGGPMRVPPAPDSIDSANDRTSYGSAYFRENYNLNGSSEPIPSLPTVNTEDFAFRHAPVLSTKFYSETEWGAAQANVGNTAGGISAGVSNSTSSGYGGPTMSYMDMNGDGYPDRINENEIEYTNIRGGRDGERAVIDLEHSVNSSISYGFNGGASISLPVEMSSKVASNLSRGVGLDYSKYSGSDKKTFTYMDINGDGLPDKVFMSDNNMQVALNLGYQFAAPINWNSNIIEMSKTEGKSIGSSHSANLDVLLKNLGNALDIAGNFGLSISAGSSGGLSSSKTLYALRDIDADGLLDQLYVEGEGSGAMLYVKFNTGNGFGETKIIGPANKFFIQRNRSLAGSYNVGGAVSAWIFFVKVSVGGSYSSGGTSEIVLNDIQDIDGDGFPDFVNTGTNFLSDMTSDESINSENKILVHRSLIGCANKLKTVSNPLGGKFTIEYERSEATFDHPGGKWVMKSVETDDGISDDGSNLRNEFSYGGGKYDRYEHEFLGFKQVTTTSADAASAAAYRSVTETYDTDSYYTKGNLLAVTLNDAEGKEFTKSTSRYYAYSVSNIAADGGNKGKITMTSVAPLNTPKKLQEKQYILYSPLKYTREEKTEHAGGGAASTVTSETFMDYYTGIGDRGELKSYKYSRKGTLGESGTGAYDYKTEIQYDKYITDAFFQFGFPKEVKVSGSDGKLLRHTNALWKFPEKNLMQLSAKLNEKEAAVTDFTYDFWGNVKSKTLPANKNGQRMTYTYDYDQIYNMYPVKITDAFGYDTEFMDYNYIYGIPLKTIDINKQVQITEIDNLGRITKIKGPKDPDYTLRFDYRPEVRLDQGGGIEYPAYAVTRHYDPQHPGNPIETVTFADGFGKIIQVKKDAFIDGQERMIVSGRVKYDPFGRVAESFYPQVGARNYDLFNYAGSEDSHKTLTEYDVLDRVTKVTLPDGTITETAYSIDGGLLKTLVTDALGKKQASYTDGSGMTVRTEQYPDENEVIATHFEFDGINRLTAVTDAMGMQTLSEYDMADRRTKVTHPASGTTEYKYDPAGNLIEKLTANLQRIKKPVKYDYDFNRLKSITYPENPKNNVKYTYGTPDAADFRAGRLVLQEDGSGAQEFKYGSMGELTEARRTLVIPNQAVATYVTKWTYDSWNRLQTMIYPDNEAVNYAYDAGGQLVSVKGSGTSDYITNITYDKFGQRTSVTYGNGTKTDYAYNPETRYLQNLQVQHAGTSIMDNTYGYDPVGNILNVSNAAPPAQYSGRNIGGNMVHTYTYDRLYRLSTAGGAFTGADDKTASYTLAMQYDRMHNITSKKQHISQTNVQFDGTLHAGYELAYTYNPANAQQIAAIRDSSYRYEGAQPPSPVEEGPGVRSQYLYDLNGNMLYVHAAGAGSTTRRLLWDEENRLTGISDNGYISNYLYDASGERTVKMHGASEGVYVNGRLTASRLSNADFTAYVSPYLVVSPGGNYTKHIYAGSQRIASRLANGTMNATTITKAGGSAVNYTTKRTRLQNALIAEYDSLGAVYTAMPVSFTGSGTNSGNLLYFYHPDHLGSSSLIT